MRRIAKLAALCACSVAALTMLPAWAGNIGPDRSFSHDGVVTTAGLGVDQAIGLAGDGDSVIVAGDTRTTEKARFHVLMSRFTKSGRPDPSFGHQGQRMLEIGRESSATGIDVLPDGDYLVTGWSRNGQGHIGVFALELRPNGSLDRTFSNDGVVWIPDLEGVLFPEVVSDSTGRIWLAWSTQKPHYVSDYRIATLSPSGHLDKSFGNRGIKTINEDRDDWLEGLTLDADDNVILVGGSGPDVHHATTVVVRIAADTHRLELRRISVWSHKSGTYPLGVSTDEQGRIWVGLTPYQNKGWGAVRLLPSLELDPTFSHSGTVTHDCDCFSDGSVLTDSGLLMLGTTGERGRGRTILRGFTANGGWDKGLASAGPWTLAGRPYMSELTLDDSGRALLSGLGGPKYSEAIVGRMQLG
jgi:uncharacterized delta-60 repeat protein